LIGILKDRGTAGVTGWELRLFIAAEVCFILSVLAGYVVLGSLTGSQYDGHFDVYRPTTFWVSRFQFATYVIGLIVFIGLALVFAV
jgi:hypothetical protein